MKLKKIPLAALAAVTITGSASAAVIAGGNGSFETVTLGTPSFPSAWRLDTQVIISGWTYVQRTANPGGALWFTGEPDYGLASDGDYMVNIMSIGASYFLQTSITGLSVDSQYTVYFDARQRDGGGGNFDVVVDTTIPAGGFNVTPTSTAWAQQSFTFTAEATSHTLRIANFDYATNGVTTTGNGLMVDNFTVVPEPSAAAFAGLAGLGLLLRRRRA